MSDSVSESVWGGADMVILMTDLTIEGKENTKDTKAEDTLRFACVRIGAVAPLRAFLDFTIKYKTDGLY